MKAKMTQKYLSEKVSFGGLMMPRGQMIAELRKMAKGDERLVNAYLGGHERHERAK